MTEVALFITDPADGKQKHVGTKQVNDDGTLVWFRRLSSDHVMRSGSFGLDAMTYDTHFKGKKGKFRIAIGGATFECDFFKFDLNRTEKDLGHGRQYFLSFSYWTEDVIVATVSPLRATPTKLVFGTHISCSKCHGKSAKAVADCEKCGGTGVLTT